MITCSAPEAFPCSLHGYAYSIEMGGQCGGDWDLFLGDRNSQGGRINAEMSPDIPSQQPLWLRKGGLLILLHSHLLLLPTIDFAVDIFFFWEIAFL